MKNFFSYFVLILVCTAGLSFGEVAPYTNIVSPKNVKRSGLGRKVQSNTTHSADKSAASNLTPKIHEGVWPDFCIHHLQSDPEGCSSWGEDKEKNVQLDFVLNGESECQIDRDLLSRLGHLIYLFPLRSQGYMRRCDYAWCRNCSQTVIRGLSCCEVEDWDDNGDEVYSYKYFPVYKCGCTGRWWLDIRLLEDEDCDIYAGWKLCKAPSIYHGYPDWHHQSYFRDLKIYLTYLEQNPSCNCYWPQGSAEAKGISDLTYAKLLNTLNNSSLEDTRNSFTPYLVERSQHGFLSGLLTHAFFYSHYRDILIDFDQHSFKENATDYPKINKYLIDIEESLQQPFVHLYTQCLAKHPHPKIYYERGMVYFHQGNNLDALDDIRHFIANVKDKGCLTSDLYLKEGRLLNESLSYDEAIVALTKAIEEDPKNREAYFERAIAYFEIGCFDMALTDYLTSGIRPKKIEKLNYITLSQGIALGMLKGGKDSVTEFVPSLLSSCRGISRGLWAFVSHPLALSQDLVDSACACIEYIRDNTPKEVLCKLVPELQECLAKWNQIDDFTKGKFIGHIIGKYGVDIFISAGSIKAITVYRNLRRANAIMTLETASISPKLAQEVLEQATKQAALRKEVLKSGNLKIQWDKQGKHLINHRNYQLDKYKSILEHPNPQFLVDKYAGTGKRIGHSNPGKPGYREVVDFQEFIGYYVDPLTKQKIPTSKGRIHYANDGVHIVPDKP